jgi:membrane carboxypeptidase/penicillin-binding protein
VLRFLNRSVALFLLRVGKLLLPVHVAFLDRQVQTALKNHRELSFGAVSQSLIQALVIAEDKRFWHHGGVDVIAIGRALIQIVFYHRLQGASTIEQQLVRTLTGYRKLSLRRKLREMILACVIGDFLNKQEIAVLYLCCAYYGWRMNSLEQACRKMALYPSKLSLIEAAELVARLKYPEPKHPSIGFSFLIARRVAYIRRKVTPR